MLKTSHWTERTSPNKERIHWIRNGHKTDTNGHERMKLFAQNNISHGSFCIFTDFDKDLAIYISQVTLYPIDVVFGGGVLLFNIGYMNRAQEIKQENEWLID